MTAQQTLTKKNASTWVHSWATGYQMLTFDSDDHAKRWAEANGAAYKA